MLYWSRMSICGSNSVQGRGEGSIVRGGSPSFLGIREVMEKVTNFCRSGCLTSPRADIKIKKARYEPFIRDQSPINCNAYLTESNF